VGCGAGATSEGPPVAAAPTAHHPIATPSTPSATGGGTPTAGERSAYESVDLATLEQEALEAVRQAENLLEDGDTAGALAAADKAYQLMLSLPEVEELEGSSTQEEPEEAPLLEEGELLEEGGLLAG